MKIDALMLAYRILERMTIASHTTASPTNYFLDLFLGLACPSILRFTLLTNELKSFSGAGASASLNTLFPTASLCGCVALTLALSANKSFIPCVLVNLIVSADQTNIKNEKRTQD
jgi:ABC-type arginine/histidine transport system permease subunit